MAATGGCKPRLDKAGQVQQCWWELQSQPLQISFCVPKATMPCHHSSQTRFFQALCHLVTWGWQDMPLLRGRDPNMLLVGGWNTGQSLLPLDFWEKAQGWCPLVTV